MEGLSASRGRAHARTQQQQTEAQHKGRCATHRQQEVKYVWCVRQSKSKGNSDSTKMYGRYLCNTLWLLLYYGTAGRQVCSACKRVVLHSSTRYDERQTCPAADTTTTQGMVEQYTALAGMCMRVNNICLLFINQFPLVLCGSRADVKAKCEPSFCRLVVMQKLVSSYGRKERIKKIL